jgi:hypothetical protein
VIGQKPWWPVYVAILVMAALILLAGVCADAVFVHSMTANVDDKMFLGKRGLLDTVPAGGRNSFLRGNCSEPRAVLHWQVSGPHLIELLPKYLPGAAFFDWSTIRPTNDAE